MKNQVQAIKNQVLEHLRQENREGLKTVIDLAHPADLAVVLQELEFERARSLFELFPFSFKCRVLEKLPPRPAARYLSNYSESRIVELIEGMAPEAVAGIFLTFDNDDRDNLMGKLEDDDFRRELIDIISYLPERAGGKMRTKYLVVDENKSVEETIDIVREAESTCFVHYIYTVDEDRCLRGVISLRRVVRSASRTRLRDLAVSDPYRVRVDDPATEAVELMRHYDLPALPVVDHQGRPRGLFTSVAAATVREEENIKNLASIAGLSAHDSFSGLREIFSSDIETWTNLGLRLPWLVAIFFGCLLGALPLVIFKDILTARAEYIFYLPFFLIVPTVVALQSAIFHVQDTVLLPSKTVKFGRGLLNEIIKTGIPIGIFFAFFAWLVPWTWHIYRNLESIRGLPPEVTGSLVGTSFISITVASATGFLIAKLYKKLEIRAVLVAPFVLAVQPVINVLIYVTVLIGFSNWF
ncbi:MAG: CBS domain-containing protein [bacterium]